MKVNASSLAWNEEFFIAFRSLSDLAGGGAGSNEIATFFLLAANNSAGVVEGFLIDWMP